MRRRKSRVVPRLVYCMNSSAKLRLFT
ncbi:MAG: hypothetical protein RL442_2048, partial [Pseudomonadota bacterium]